MSEVSVSALFDACGNDGHDIPEYDEPLSLDETWDVLSQVHPAVMGRMVEMWAQGREENGFSSAEHPHFREKAQLVLDTHPDGYSHE